MKRRDFMAVVAGSALGLAVGHSPAVADDVSFDTLNVIMSVPAGSGGDIAGRIFTKHMAGHLPGNPNVVPQNRPGAAGAVALNFMFENAPKDGATIYYGAWNAPAVLEQREGVRYVPEEMGVIGSGVGFPSLVVRKDVAQTALDLEDADQFIVGGRGATRTIEILGNLALRLLDVDFRYVGGFGGFGKIAPAIKANEVQAGHAGLAGATRFFGTESEPGHPVYHHVNFDAEGNVVNPAEGTYPPATMSIIDVYKAFNDGAEPSGPYWEAYKWHRSNIMAADQAVIAPPGVPDAVVDVLREAYQATANDPAFLAEYTEVIGTPQYYNSTEATLNVFANYRNRPEGITATIEEISGL